MYFYCAATGFSERTGLLLKCGQEGFELDAGLKCSNTLYR